MARANIISVVAANPQDVPSAAPVTWKIGDSVPGSPDLVVRQLVLFNGGVTVFAIPSSGSKTELEFIQHMGMRQGFIFNLAASTVKMTVAVAPIDVFDEIRVDTYENADDNFDDGDDEADDELEGREEGREEEEEEEELEPPQQAAPPVMAPPAPAPSFLPSAENLSEVESP